MDKSISGIDESVDACMKTVVTVVTGTMIGGALLVVGGIIWWFLA